MRTRIISSCALTTGNLSANSQKICWLLSKLYKTEHRKQAENSPRGPVNTREGPHGGGRACPCLSAYAVQL